jgi:hypothetical protein
MRISHTAVHPLLQTGVAEDVSAVYLLQLDSSVVLVVLGFLADGTLWFEGRVVCWESGGVLNLCW